MSPSVQPNHIQLVKQSLGVTDAEVEHLVITSTPLGTTLLCGKCGCRVPVDVAMFSPMNVILCELEALVKKHLHLPVPVPSPLVLERPPLTEMEKELKDPDLEKIDVWFKYHTPTPDQITAYGQLRDAAHMMARVILLHCPRSADRTAALRKLREAVMTANASIACKGI